jgi:hypothetical protein
MKHGMILAFDDYYCYSARTLSGERRACLEFLQADSRFHFSPFAQFGWHGMSFIVEDRVTHPSPQPASSSMSCRDWMSGSKDSFTMAISHRKG